MPYELSWYREKRVVLVKIQGDMTLENAFEYSDAIYEMVDSGIAPVHIIADLTEIGKFPPSLISLRNATRYLLHPKAGWIMLIGGPIMAQVFGEVLTRLTRINFRLVTSFQEAADALLEADATLVRPEDSSS